MKCPFCGYTESKVVDSRPTDDSERIRRRRECLRCQKRFTTYEVVETVPIIVIKKNGMQEPFDREKLLRGVLRACEKRPVPVEKLEKLVTDIETELQNSMQREVTSETIGELALAALRLMSVLHLFTGVSRILIRSWRNWKNSGIPMKIKHKTEAVVSRAAASVLFCSWNRHKMSDFETNC